MKFDLVHQTVSPHERVGSGDETNSGNAQLELTLPNICWIEVALEFRTVSKLQLPEGAFLKLL